MSKWEWDRKSIRDYREKHEPYNDFEKMMLDQFKESPFMLPIWKNRFSGKRTCWECGETVLSSKQTLPSRLVVMTLRCSNPTCTFFEQLVLTDEDEVIDYQRKPEIKTGGKARKPTKEEIEKFERALKAMKE